MGCRVYDLGFGVWGSGFGGLWFGVCRLGFRVAGLGFRDPGIATTVKVLGWWQEACETPGLTEGEADEMGVKGRLARSRNGPQKRGAFPVLISTALPRGRFAERSRGRVGCR